MAGTISYPGNPNEQDIRKALNQVLHFLYENQFATQATESGDVKADGSVSFTGIENFLAALKTDGIYESTTSAGIGLNNLTYFLTGNGIVAAGNSQGTARLIAKQFSTVTGADGTKGVKLPAGLSGAIILIANDNSGILPVYPNTGQTIDGGAANAAITLAANETRLFFSISTTSWVSAQFLSHNWFVNTSGTFLPTADNTYDIGNGSVNPRDITASRDLIAKRDIAATGNISTTSGVVNGGSLQTDSVINSTGVGLRFQCLGTDFWIIDTNTGNFLPHLNNSYDIGDGSTDPRDIHASRNIASKGLFINSSQTGKTATGTNQATAYVIAAQFTEFTTVGLGTGAVLPATIGTYTIVGNGANDLLVYPPSGGQINGLGANNPYTLAHSTTPGRFTVVSATQMYI